MTDELHFGSATWVAAGLNALSILGVLFALIVMFGLIGPAGMPDPSVG